MRGFLALFLLLFGAVMMVAGLYGCAPAPMPAKQNEMNRQAVACFVSFVAGSFVLAAGVDAIRTLPDTKGKP